MSDPTTPNEPWRKAAPLLVLAVLLAYANAAAAGFVFDDTLWITRNTSIGDPAQYLRESLNRLLVSATVLANYRLGGTNPLGYHLFNVGVHLAAALTLFGLLRRVFRLPRWGGRFDGRADRLAFAAALLWAVHPLNTQAVTYVIQRAESMHGLFFLLTFYCWTRAATGGSKGVWLALAALSCLAACQCKEVAVTLLPLLVLYDRVFLAAGWREVAGRWPGYLGVGVGWAAKMYQSLAGAFGGGGTAVGVGFGLAATPTQYALTQTVVILHYLRLAVWPTGQSADYSDWAAVQSVGEVWPSAAALAVLVAGTAAALFVRPAVGFLGAWFFVILAPSSSVMPIHDVAFEHRMYLSLVAVAVGAVLAFDYGLRRVRRPSARAALGTLALLAAAVPLALATHARNRVYRNERVFWESVLAVRPHNLRAHTTVASFLIDEQRFAEANAMLDEVVPRAAGYVGYRYNRGRWYLYSGDVPTAERWFDEMLDDPWPRMLLHVGGATVTAHLMGDNPPAAAAVARRLVGAYPHAADHHFLLAATTCDGRREEVAAALTEAVRLDPAVLARYAAEARGLLLERRTIPASRRAYLEIAYRYAAAVCAADADHPERFDTLAMAAAHTGRFKEAEKAAKDGIEAAGRANDPVWKAALEDRLKVYEAGRVYGPKE